MLQPVGQTPYWIISLSMFCSIHAHDSTEKSCSARPRIAGMALHAQVTFKWKKEEVLKRATSRSGSDAERNIGFIAQEVQDVVPELVHRYAARALRIPYILASRTYSCRPLQCPDLDSTCSQQHREPLRRSLAVCSVSGKHLGPVSSTVRLFRIDTDHNGKQSCTAS